MGTDICPDIRAYLLNGLERPKSFSLKSPHSCASCTDILIDGAALRRAKISQTSAGEVRVSLRKGLREALQAANGGCAFYKWLLNFLLRYPSERAEIGRARSVSFELLILMAEHSTVEIRIDVLYSNGELKSFPGYFQPDIFMCTTENNAAAEQVQARPPQLDVASPEAVKWASECLQTCLRTHAGCRTAETLAVEVPSGPDLVDESFDVRNLPSRLLKVRKEPSLSAKLVEVSEMALEDQTQISRAGYVSLSYCWGAEQRKTLTRESYQALKEGIPLVEFAQTIQDAIWFTAALGFQYIWIDALCIFQDDENDKQVEIGRMAAYYGGNSITLCAASASGATKGFLEPRSEGRYEFGPFQIAYQAETGDGFVTLYQESKPAKDPVALRAWTLQESLLSRRMLIFSARQLYWCCRTSTYGCGGPASRVRERALCEPDHLVPGIYPFSGVLRNEEQLWDAIVMDFTTRKMSLESDKLLAISALAAYYSRVTAELNLTYLAGLFLDPSSSYYSLRQLLWGTVDPLTSHRAKQYRAPTWSWASLNGEIDLLHRRSIYPLKEDVDDSDLYRVKLKMLQSQADPITDVAPFGAVKQGGFIVFRNPIRVIRPDDKIFRAIAELRSLSSLDREEDRPYLSLCPDTTDDWMAIQRLISQSRPIHCLVLLSSRRESRAFGLLLTPQSTTARVFLRMGIFALMNSPPDRNGPEAELGGNFFFTPDNLPVVKVL